MTSPVFSLRGHSSPITSLETIALNQSAVTTASSCQHRLPISSQFNDLYGYLLISGSSDGNLKVWDMKTRRPLYERVAHDGDLGVLSVRNCSVGSALRCVTQSRNHSVKIWDLEYASSAVSMCLDKKLEVRSLTFCKCVVLDEHLIAVPCPDEKEVLVWDSRADWRQSLKITFSGDEGAVMSLTKMSDASTLACGLENGAVSFWDVRYAAAERFSFKMFKMPVMACAASTSLGLECIAVGSSGRFLGVAALDLSKDVVLQKKQLSLSSEKGGVSELRSCGDVLGAAVWGGKVKLYDWKSLSEKKTFDNHSATANCLAFYPNASRGRSTSSFVATGGKDRRILLQACD